MTNFLDAAIAYPTAIYTTLLGIVLVYWILALIGVVDIETSGVDIDIGADIDIDADINAGLHADAQAEDIGDLAAFLVACGLNGVPFSVVVTLMTLIAWTLSCLAGMWILPLVPTLLLQLAAGTGVLVASFALALPVTARAIRPMRGLFVTHRARSNMDLVGRSCLVLTGTVDERFGRAQVNTRGAGLNIRVWAETPNALSKGVRARIIDYDKTGERYQIVAEP